MRMYRRNTSSRTLAIFLTIMVVVLLASACGSRSGGKFVGSAKVSGGGYATDESIPDVTITVASKDSTQYYLTFADNSPLQCKLLLDNMNSEDQNPNNDDDLLFRRIQGSNACELRGKNGQTQTGKITSISGGQLKDGYLSLEVTFDGQPSGLRFSYQGWPK